MRKLLLLIPFVVACTNNFKEGETLFAKRQFNEAKIFYTQVKPDDEEYIEAQERLVQIDKMITEEVLKARKQNSTASFREGKTAYAIQNYASAQVAFEKVDPSSIYYKQSQDFITKINDLLEKRKNARYEQAKADMIYEAKIAKATKAAEEKEKRIADRKEANRRDKIKHWKVASVESKLELSRVLAEAAYKNRGVSVTTLDMYNCIEEAIKGHDIVDDEKIATIADLCITMMK